MRDSFLKYLACPDCNTSLRFENITEMEGDSIKEGALMCNGCHQKFSIAKFIPRFVSAENYAKGFGFQWKIHAKTQLDSYSGIPISENRFFRQTQWPHDLTGEIILEVGSGAGRFTEQAAKTNAMVISLDYSLAVEANYLNNGYKKNVFIVQGDIYRMPFPKKFFDKVFCFGVIQHTPNPFKAFRSLLNFVKKNGLIAIDVYRNHWKCWVMSKYYLRPITRRISPEKLYKIINNYICFMWPICKLIRKIPMIGPKINLIFGIPDHSELKLSEHHLKEWAILDSFDMFSPRYDFPQKLATVKKWLESQELENTVVIGEDLGLVVARARVKTSSPLILNSNK